MSNIKPIVLTALFALLLLSCKSIKYVPVETVKTEYKTNTVHDSVYFEILKHDSVIIATKQDTVYVTKYHYLYKDRWKEKIVTDTLIVNDTIQVPYPVEKQMSKWDKVCLKLGYVFIGACILFGIMLILFVVRKFK